MRWTLTSPDGIGDFILRLPWIIRMQECGWELQLLARGPTLELADLAGIKGEFVELSQNPYSKEAKCSLQPFKRDFAAIEKFQPGILFFAPSQPTFLEEQATKRFPHLKKGGFFLKEGFWPSEGLENPRDLAKAYQFQIEVSAGFPDFYRNQSACQFLLGFQDALTPYFLPSEQLSLSVAKDCLDSGREYVVVSPGVRSGDYFKGWGAQNWIRELKKLESAIPHQFVFVGGPNEILGNAKIFEGLSDPKRHLNLTGKTPTLRDLIGVLGRSKGYLGKDCGTMHLACICNLPVLAVFGGGHRDRFFPPYKKSTSVTVDVPCRGCDWRCHLPEHICVSGIPEGLVSEFFERKLSLPDNGFPNLELPAQRHALDLLKNNPIQDYPERCHRIKKDRQKKECRTTVLNWPFRAIQTFLAK